MNYAVDYAEIEATKIACWDTNPQNLTTLILNTPQQKLDFLNEIRAGDTAWMELGGAGDVFSLIAMQKGASVNRIPSFKLKEERDSEQQTKESDHTLLALLAQIQPDLFYPMRQVDEQIVKLRVLIRARTVVQRTVRVPTQQRLNWINRELWLLESSLTEPCAEALKTYLKRKIVENPIFAGASAYEKDLDRQIQRVLQEIPVYKAVFEPVRGCGPIIGGTIIARMVDIRRFYSRDALKAYAGYHLAIDGQLIRRQQGQREPWDHVLHQAIWFFTDVTNRQPPDTPWKTMLLERKRYERECHPKPVVVRNKTLYTDLHIHNRALRWLGQQFIKKVCWQAWREFEGLI